MFEQFDHCLYHADSWMHNRGNKGLCVKHSKTIRRKDQTLHLLQPIITPDKSTQIEFFVSTKTWNDLKPPKTTYNHLQPSTTTSKISTTTSKTSIATRKLSKTI